MTAYIDPCEQIRQTILSHLRGLCGGFRRPINQTQIREILDISGEPKDSAGVIVACENQGEHWGANNNGVLIDVQPRIVVFSHLNEDSDGAICNALVSDVLGAMQSISYTGVSGWDVKWRGNWTVSDKTMEGSYRQVEMTATLPLVRLFSIQP